MSRKEVIMIIQCAIFSISLIWMNFIYSEVQDNPSNPSMTVKNNSADERGDSLTQQQDPSSEQIKSAPLLENNLFNEVQPDQDLLEIVEVMDQKNQRGSPSQPVEQETVTGQLIETERDNKHRESIIEESRQLAQSSEDTDFRLDNEEDNETEPIKRNNLIPLIRESLFEKVRVRRDLDVYIDENEVPVNDAEEVLEDLGNVEVRWKSSD